MMGPACSLDRDYWIIIVSLCLSLSLSVSLALFLSLSLSLFLSLPLSFPLSLSIYLSPSRLFTWRLGSTAITVNTLALTCSVSGTLVRYGVLRNTGGPLSLTMEMVTVARARLITDSALLSEAITSNWKWMTDEKIT